MTPNATGAAQAAQPQTMTKKEVIEYLGKSKRTVETLIAAGRLPVSYFNGPNGKQASFEAQAVEHLKVQMETPMVRARPAPSETSTANPNSIHDSGATLVLSSPAMTAVATAMAEAVRAALQGAALVAQLPAGPQGAALVAKPKPWLTAEEAEEFSGLPKRWLLKMARDPEAGPGIHVASCVMAMNVGTENNPKWRFNRGALGRVKP
jgi:hypothetical protein